MSTPAPLTLDPDAPRCLIIAEIAQAHDGSLGTAHAYIDAAANAGADAVKFQTHIAAAESTPDEPWRVKFSPQDATRYAYWQRMEFTPEQWRGLQEHATARGLAFLSSPFSLAAVSLLARVGVSAWKIASGEVSNVPLLEAIAAHGQPVLLSSGMSTLAEIDAAVARVQAAGCPLAVLQCTSRYPTPPETVGLNLIPFFRARYGCSAGLSDHSGAIYAGLAAAALGAGVLEVHLAFSREAFGPDVPASITPAELRALVEGVRFIDTARAHPVDKDAAAAGLAEMRGLFFQSIIAARDLPAGALLAAQDLTTRKPGTGIPAAEWHAVIGRRTARPVAAGARLAWADLEGGQAG
ncbi:MAG: N-acetylneuraminate synthase family protein [Anaerolineae bacterium]|nr:N-acetylneuraminate synthase family protein [Anaerolineae bacterium]